MPQIQLAVSKTWQKIAAADKQTFIDKEGNEQPVPIICNQGGMSSGKTWGTLLHLIFKYGVMAQKSRKIELFRKHYSDLDGSIIRDFFDILDLYGIYNPKSHRKPSGKVQYTIHSTAKKGVKTTYFFKGLDDRNSKVKKRGPRRDISYFNELNDFNLDDFVQITGRTREKTYADFNPSAEFWFNEKYLDHEERISGEDYIWIKTTYLDNVNIKTGKSFLPAKQLKELEDLIKIDEYYYKVYVLGELAQVKGLIYDDKLFGECTEEYFHSIPVEECENWYGVDWGYEHNMVMIHFKYYQEKIYEHVIFCDSKYHDDDLVSFVDNEYVDNEGYPIIRSSDEIYCDHAYPASINKFKDQGYNARKADKSVHPGIKFCQGIRRIVTDTSRQHRKERKRYKWKQDSNDKVHVGVPVKIDDDVMDAERYGLYTHLKRRTGFGVII